MAKETDSEGQKAISHDKKKERRGYQSTEAIDPRDGGKWDILIAPKMVEWVRRQGMGKARELVYVVRPSLIKIRHLFRGIRDVDGDVCEDQWLCYTATPSKAYDYKTGEERNAWQGEVLLIYVTDERVLYNWFWYMADSTDPGLPADHETRFRERVF